MMTSVGELSLVRQLPVKSIAVYLEKAKKKKDQFKSLFMSRDKSDLMKQCAPEISRVNAHPA